MIRLSSRFIKFFFSKVCTVIEMNLTCIHVIPCISSAFVYVMQMIQSCYDNDYLKMSFLNKIFFYLYLFSLLNYQYLSCGYMYMYVENQQIMTNTEQCIYLHTYTCHYCCCQDIAYMYMYITFAVCLTLLVE